MNKVQTSLGVIGRFTKAAKEGAVATSDLLKAAAGMSLEKNRNTLTTSSAAKLPPLKTKKPEDESILDSEVTDSRREKTSKDSKREKHDSKRIAVVAGEGKKNVIALPSLHGPSQEGGAASPVK